MKKITHNNTKRNYNKITVIKVFILSPTSGSKLFIKIPEADNAITNIPTKGLSIKTLSLVLKNSDKKIAV